MTEGIVITGKEARKQRAIIMTLYWLTCAVDTINVKQTKKDQG